MAHLLFCFFFSFFFELSFEPMGRLNNVVVVVYSSLLHRHAPRRQSMHNGREHAVISALECTCTERAVRLENVSTPFFFLNIEHKHFA